MTHGKTYNKSPRRINHKATRSKTNTGTTALELTESPIFILLCVLYFQMQHFRFLFALLFCEFGNAVLCDSGHFLIYSFFYVIFISKANIYRFVVCSRDPVDLSTCFYNQGQLLTTPEKGTFVYRRKINETCTSILYITVRAKLFKANDIVSSRFVKTYIV